MSNNRYWSHVTKDGRRQDCVLDKLHKVSFEKSRGSDKKYFVEERMWPILADGGMADVAERAACAIVGIR